MTSETNIDPVLNRVAQGTAKQETLHMSHDEWRRLGRCVAWCYLPMLILDSLLIFGISVEVARPLLFVKVVSWLVPIIVTFTFLVRRIWWEYSRRRPVPRRLAWRRPPVKKSELLYLSWTFSTVGLLYVPMHLASSGLVKLGDHLIGKRAEPVIAATEKYMAVHGSLPPDVYALFPDYLSALPYGMPPVYFARSVTINGYSPGYWYVSVRLSPAGFFQRPQWLTYCSGGIDGIYARQSAPCGPWMRCIDN